MSPSDELLRAPLAHRYRVQAPLGSGGQGSVWAALDELTGAEVAVKLLGGGATPEGARREIAVLRSLRLPPVVRLVDEGTWQGERFVVTERGHGRPFPGVPSPVAWVELAEPLRRLLVAVGQVHRAGVVHGDLKPANVLVDERGRVRLLDFGMARFHQGPGAHPGAAPAGGTLHYLAPEVIAGSAAGPAADLFAIGVMAVRALLDRPPWPAVDLRALVAARRARPVFRPADCGLSLPPAVEAGLTQLLQLDPGLRPSSAVQALQVLGLAPPEVHLPLPWAERGPPLRADELAQVFDGPERVLHLPGDAAALLHAATGGDRTRVRAELQAWIDAGVGEERAGRLHVPRPTLDQLARHRSLPLASPTGAPLPGDPRARRLLALIDLAGALARPGLLALAEGGSPAEIDALLARLAATGAARVDTRGAWHDLSLGAASAALSPQVRSELHRALAAAVEDPAVRLDHLLAAGAPLAELVDTAFAAARAGLREGHSARALATVELLLHLVGPEDLARPGALALLDLYVTTALESDSPPLLRRAAWELRRLPGTPLVLHRIELLEAGALALGGRPEEALTRVQALAEPGGEDHLERMVLAVQVAAAQHLPLEGEDFVLEHLAPAARTLPGLDAALSGWLGHLRHRQGRYAEAAELHARCARGRHALHARISASLDEAAALIAAGRLREAHPRVLQARVLATEARDAAREARAWGLERQLAWLEGRADAPDEALVDAALEVGEPAVVARLALVEAAIAREGGYVEATARLARRARTGFEATGAWALAVLAAALGAEAGDAAALWWACDHVPEDAQGHDTRVLLQAAALLYLATAHADWAALGARWAAALQPEELGLPGEVLPLERARMLVATPI